MGLNGKQFAKRHGVRPNRIKAWFDAGYLGNATKDKKTGQYDIPEDTPVPYSADQKVKRNTALWKQLLDAADKNCMVCSKMYPLIPEDAFDAQINEMIEERLLEFVSTESGVSYLRILPAGRNLLLSFEGREGKNLLEKVERIVANGANALTIGQVLMDLGQLVMTSQIPFPPC